VDVVILAGGRCEPELAALTGAEFRADVPFQGRTCLEIVLSAASGFGDPLVVGGRPGLHPRQTPGGAHFVESVRLGLERVRTDTFLLVTVDLPCLKADSLGRFIELCDPAVGLNYPIVPAEVCQREFPGLKRTTLRLREGTFTGGNVALLNRDLMRRALPVLEAAYAARKSPLRLARMAGPSVLGQVVLGRLFPASLRLKRLEQAVGKFLGVEVRAVVGQDADIATDVDSAAQMRVLLRLTNG
jgi:hypothetical protein